MIFSENDRARLDYLLDGFLTLDQRKHHAEKQVEALQVAPETNEARLKRVGDDIDYLESNNVLEHVGMIASRMKAGGDKTAKAHQTPRGDKYAKKGVVTLRFGGETVGPKIELRPVEGGIALHGTGLDGKVLRWISHDPTRDVFKPDRDDPTITIRAVLDFKNKPFPPAQKVDVKPTVRPAGLHRLYLPDVPRHARP